MSLSTYERAYGDGTSRQAYLRALRQEAAAKAEADRMAVIRAEARRAIERARLARINAALENILRPLLDRLQEQRLEAARRGEQARADAFQREQDQLINAFNEIARSIR